MIIIVLDHSTAVKTRTLEKVSGKIIVMSSAQGFVAQVMTRRICISFNIFEFKPASLLEKTCNFDMFTDVSVPMSAGFINNTTYKVKKL